MVSMPSPPTPPDPVKTAQAQGQANRDTAIAQAYLGDVNQITPYGSIMYSSAQRAAPTPIGGWDAWAKQTGWNNATQSFTGGGSGPTGGSGFGGGGGFGGDGFNGGGAPSGMWPGSDIPQITATTTLSPEMKALVDANILNATQAAHLQGQLQTNASQQLTKPLDLSWGATEQKLADLNKHQLDPQWAQGQQQLNQQLADQGLTPGSEGYNFQQTQFGRQKANAYENATLSGHQQAVSDLEAQYNSPINILSALRGGTQVSQPGVGQLAPSTSPQIQPPPYASLVEQNFAQQSQNWQQQAAQQQAAMGGMFGLGGSLLGGLGSIIGSDRRDKTDVKPLGKDNQSGLPMYAYRYKGDPKTYPKTVGPMAQDVEKMQPGAVREVGGHKVIGFGLGGAR